MQLILAAHPARQYQQLCGHTCSVMRMMMMKQALPGLTEDTSGKLSDNWPIYDGTHLITANTPTLQDVVNSQHTAL